MTSRYDAVVVGAGAAGIAAARELAGAGRSVLVIEARDRVGGRAWTVHHQGLPIDLGCGWLHSADRNPWTALASTLGFAIDRNPPPWGRQFLDIGFSPADQVAARDAVARFEARLRHDSSGTDRAADLLENAGRWNPYLDALSSYVNGAELERLSIRDYLAYVEADTGVNWRVVKGYGELVAAAASGLPIQTGTVVSAIDARGRLLCLATTKGVLEADTAIVTIPTDLLAAGTLALPPELDDHLDAAARLPLGVADKVIFRIDGPDGFEAETLAIGNPLNARTGSYHLRPFGRPFIEGYLGGLAARELEARCDMVDFALEELVGLFGSDIRRRLKPIAQSRWVEEPFSRGSYSHALPGHAQARDVLARGWDERIYFAGEACSRSDFSTAHGAYATGVAAAQAILKRREGRWAGR